MNVSSKILTKQARLAAERQAARIVEYWADRGYSVCAKAVPLPYCNTYRHRPYEIRTDLVNGLPRDWKGRAA